MAHYGMFVFSEAATVSFSVLAHFSEAKCLVPWCCLSVTLWLFLLACCPALDFLPFTTKNLLLQKLNSCTSLGRHNSLFWKIQNLSFLCREGLTPAWRLPCPARRSWHAAWSQSPAQNIARTHFKDMGGKHLLFIQPLTKSSFPVISLPVTGKTSPRVSRGRVSSAQRLGAGHFIQALFTACRPGVQNILNLKA